MSTLSSSASETDFSISNGERVEPMKDPRGADPGVDDLYAAWNDAFRRGDVEAAVALLTADYVLWASGAPPLNVDALRPRFAAAFAAYEITSAFECEERLISGDLAFDRGWDVQQVRPPRSGSSIRGHTRASSHGAEIYNTGGPNWDC
jgi:ketosteroid isomerase-like protein